MTEDVVGYKEKVGKVGGLRLHHLEWGTPGSSPMVLLHGSAWSAHDWDFFAPSFVADYHIFVPDQRGRGLSDMTEPPSFKTKDHVRDLVELVEVWGIDSFVLIGFSMGGHNAMAYASQFPARVSALVVVDCAPSIDGWENYFTEVEPPAFDSLNELVAWHRATSAPLADETILRHVWKHSAYRLSDGRLMAFAAPSLLGLDRDQQLEAWPPPDDLWDAIQGITCPALIVRAENSPFLGEEDVVERMVQAIPRARLVTVEGATHLVPFDKPVEFAGIVKEFLAQCDAP